MNISAAYERKYTQVCYSNGICYPAGDYKCSGDELLGFENGIWVRSDGGAFGSP